MRRLIAAVLMAGTLAPPLVVVAEPACVGTPARQTIDPMSPACIPSFDGDNGGATATGVTRARVEVVLYNDLGIDGDLNLPWQATDEDLAHFGDPTGADTNLVRTAKALVRHFNERYQTYGREVRVTAVSSTLGETPLCAARSSDVTAAIATYHPFAVATLGAAHGCVFDATAAAGIVGAGAAAFVREHHVAPSRTAFTFAPTLERSIAASTSFLCRSLKGRPARFAGGSLVGATRRVALIYPSPGDTWLAETAAGLSVRAFAECGLLFTPTRSYRSGQPADLAAAVNEAFLARATTIVCLCPQRNQEALLAVTTARGLQYQPEWIWLPETRVDRATAVRGFADPLGRHFGISPTWMAPGPDSQQAVLAARDGDPDVSPNTLAVTDLFVALRLLFTGIQTAGPGLTPASFASGLTSFAPSGSIGERVPGSFPVAGPRAWTSSFVGWWFDPLVAAPGSTVPRGCMRLIRDGVRFEPDSWPSNDLDWFSSGACTGDLHRQPLDTPAGYLSTVGAGVADLR